MFMAESHCLTTPRIICSAMIQKVDFSCLEFEHPMEMQNQTKKNVNISSDNSTVQELKYKNWEKVFHRHVPLHNWTVEHNYSILLNIKIENTNAKLTCHKKNSTN
jgi:hypothetical protein